MPTAELTIARTINASWGGMRSWLRSYAAQNAIRGGQTGAVLSGLPWDEWIYALGDNTDPMKNLISTAAKRELKTIGARTSFNVVDAISVRYGTEQSSKLIKNLQDTTRATVRGVIGDAMAGKYTVDSAARQLEKVVGLHPAWAEAVIKRGEGAYLRALKDGRSEVQARAFQDKVSEKYAAKLTRARAMNIARTETMTAANVGRWATWEHAVNNGFAGPLSQKEWSPGPGSCPGCMQMSGERTPWNTVYSNGLMMPPAHPGCRCTSQLIPEEVAQQLGRTDWTSPNLPQHSPFEAPKVETPKKPKAASPFAEADNPLVDVKSEIPGKSVAPLTVEKMPVPLGKPLSPQEAADGANPKRGALGLANNCSNCVTTYEMRRRGFDVVAMGTPGAKGRMTSQYTLDWWHNKDGSPVHTDYFFSARERTAIFKDMPDGARGYAMVAWKQGGGHVFSWEKRNGKVELLEPQLPPGARTGAPDPADYWKHSKPSGQIIRMDDKIPNEKVLKAFQKRDPNDWLY